MNKKSQGAFMEFLMTYGWAILGFVIAIGVLAYFGVFSSQPIFTITKEECWNETTWSEPVPVHLICSLKENYTKCVNTVKDMANDGIIRLSYGEKYGTFQTMYAEIKYTEQKCETKEVDEMDYGVWYRNDDNAPEHIFVSNKDLTENWLNENCECESHDYSLRTRRDLGCLEWKCRDYEVTKNE